MLECLTCLQRCIRAIAGDSLSTTAIRTPLNLTSRISRTSRRPLATAATVHREEDALTALEGNPSHGTSSKKSRFTSSHSERQLKTELEYLRDPAKLADHVHYTLRQQKPYKALDLCRLASKTMSCVVAWNHLLDWMMRSGKVNEAIKTYNEMKKRGQFPDSYTYMQLLRGFPKRGDNDQGDIMEQNVVKAVSIYTSMSSPTSRVKPSIMHTNATLRVCSMARDMDALWNVASKIPDHGSGAADEKTYSILLGAIRFGAFGKGDEHTIDMPVERIAQIRQQAVNEGRRIWQEVVDKWRSGEVLIDETLVVEMANLLLFGKRMEDWDDVLNLIRQTTNIERLVAPLDSAERQIGHVPSGSHIDPQTTTVEDEEGWVPTPASNAFKSVSPHKYDPQHPKRPKQLPYVPPGNGILNVLIIACTHMRIPKAAIGYWNTLTNEYGVVPDRNNFKEMLRLLQYNRSSMKAVEIVQQMHTKFGIPAHSSTYRIAMAVLARDWKNVRVVDAAMSLVDDMEQHLDTPDIETLRSVLSLALQTNESDKIVRVLERLRTLIPRLRIGFKRGNTEKQYFADFLKAIISSIDTCLRGELVSEKDVVKLNDLRNSVNWELGEVLNKGPSSTWAWKRERGTKRLALSRRQQN